MRPITVSVKATEASVPTYSRLERKLKVRTRKRNVILQLHRDFLPNKCLEEGEEERLPKHASTGRGGGTAGKQSASSLQYGRLVR